MAPALVVVGAGRWFRLRWLASVVLLLSFAAFPAWCALWRVLRGVSAAPGRVWYLCRAGASAVLRAFYIVFAAWCAAGVQLSQAVWALILGGWWRSPAWRCGGSSRRLGVVPGPLCGAVTGCGAGGGRVSCSAFAGLRWACVGFLGCLEA